MKEVDEQGGIVRAVAEGRIQAAVSRQAYEYFKELEAGEVRKVGENCYRIEEEEPEVAFHPFKEEVLEEQVKRLDRIRTQRDNDRVACALKSVLADAKAGRNVMPGMIEAVEGYATVGELTHCLVEAYGRYEEPVLF
jgi:methylmalonyl-CoA mutase N-terminal domain/subunit